MFVYFFYIKTFKFIYPLLLSESKLKYKTDTINTIQYSTVQYSTVQYSTVQYNTVQFSITLCLESPLRVYGAGL